MLAVVHRSHGNTRPGPPGRRRKVCFAPVGASRIAASAAIMTTRQPVTSQANPISSMRANGLLLSQPKRSIAVHPRSIAFAKTPSARSRTQSSISCRQRLGGTPRGGRSGSSWARPASQLTGSPSGCRGSVASESAEGGETLAFSKIVFAPHPPAKAAKPAKVLSGFCI